MYSCIDDLSHLYVSLLVFKLVLCMFSVAHKETAFADSGPSIPCWNWSKSTYIQRIRLQNNISQLPYITVYYGEHLRCTRTGDTWYVGNKRRFSFRFTHFLCFLLYFVFIFPSFLVLLVGGTWEDLGYASAFHNRPRISQSMEWHKQPLVVHHIANCKNLRWFQVVKKDHFWVTVVNIHHYAPPMFATKH